MDLRGESYAITVHTFLPGFRESACEPRQRAAYGRSRPSDDDRSPSQLNSILLFSGLPGTMLAPPVGWEALNRSAGSVTSITWLTVHCGLWLATIIAQARIVEGDGRSGSRGSAGVMGKEMAME